MNSIRSISCIVGLTGAIFALSSCEGGSGAPTPMPNVSISCSSGNCSGAAGSHSATVVFTLSGCAQDQINFETVASGGVNVFCTGGTCSGTVLSWRDTNGNIVNEIISRSYYLCGWVDINDNAIKENSSDAFSDEVETVTPGQTITITDWSATRQF